MRLKLSFILLISLIACISYVQAWGLGSIVTRLAEYQTTDGGFRGTDGKPSAEATSNALMLASLYGLQSKINTTDTANFVESLANSDGGYGPFAKTPSDIEATRNALLSLQHLGGKPKDAAKVVTYIKSLQDKNTGLFSTRVGEKGSVKGTALALQSLDALGELNQVKDSFGKLKEYLNKHRSTGETLYFSFPDEKDVTSHVTANYYGIVVANYVGVDFGTPSKWAKYIIGLQSPGGQFYDSSDKKGTSLASTAHAVRSLALLGALKGAERFVDAIHLDNLKKGIRHLASDLTSAGHTHGTLALTDAFKDFFHTVVNHDEADDDSLIEGADYNPSLSVSSIFDEFSHPHGGFDVEHTTTFHGKQGQKQKLTWDQTLQRYIGQKYPTVGNLGPVKSLFSLVHKVAGLGDISLNLDSLRNIGYGLTVVPKVTQAGRTVRENEPVSVGTEFNFAVSLSTKSNANLESGDFSVTFSVVDSSGVVAHQSKVDGSKNKGSISFNYKLDNPNIPPGQLTFRFEVSGAAAPHTTRTVKYQYGTQLVASHIEFQGAPKGPVTYKLGDKVKVSIEPAVFPDYRNVHPLATKDANGADVTDSRHFFLDIKSPQGVLVHSVASTATKGSPKYTFDFTVDPVLDFIGTHHLSFRYVPAVGDEITLLNYDSTVGELFDDTQVVSFKVNADLALDVSQAPKAGDLFYGSLVDYQFRLKDAISEQHVYVGEKSLANVFLDLSHEGAGGKPYTSLHHPATVSGTDKNRKFNVNWIVNPNVAQGAGNLALSVVDVDGKVISVKDSKHLKVSIGGQIDVAPHTYTTTLHTSRQTAIVTEVVLTCKDKILKDADLTADVVRDGSVIGTLPVAHNNGRYTVSWAGAHKDIPSDTYQFRFYRNSDRTRAQEQRDQREKRERKERELRGETATVHTTTDEVLSVKPLFVVDVPYSAPTIVQLPVRAEFLGVVLLGGFLVWLSMKRSNLQ